MFSLLYFTRGHILIDLVVNFLRRARPWRHIHFLAAGFFVHSWLFLRVIGIIKVLWLRLRWLLRLIEPILRPWRHLLV